jgi:hypothetical protein
VNTIEQNKLFAEFMEWEMTSDGKAFFNPFGDSQYFNPEKGIVEKASYHSKLLFNTSWDWLMLVIERIENIETHSTNMRKGLGGWGQVCTFSNSDIEIKVVGDSDESKISVTYKAVAKFIQWYNENRKP